MPSLISSNRLPVAAPIHTGAARPERTEDRVNLLNTSRKFSAHSHRDNAAAPELRAADERVVGDAFLSALDRDEHLKRCWVVLVDGNEAPLAGVHTQAKSIGIELTVVLACSGSALCRHPGISVIIGRLSRATVKGRPVFTL